MTTSWDDTARVWRADGTDTAIILAGHYGRIPSASFSPNGMNIVTASWDTTARIWPLHSIEENVTALWHATSYCMPEEQRIQRLGEAEDEAKLNVAACQAKVTEYAAQGAYR